jgi:hypothetical protein
MKKIIVPSLLASLLFVAPALANEINGNNECNQAIRSGNCLNAAPGHVNPPVGLPRPPHPPGPPPVDYGGGYGHGWHRGNPGGVYFNFQTNPYNDYYDNNYNDGYGDNYDDSYFDRCTSIGQSLRHSGFRRVKVIGCAGRNYIYTASRDGERLRITVSRNSGRILKIRPIY